MRWLTGLAAVVAMFAAVAWTPPASAQPVAVGEVGFSSQFERSLDLKLGRREGGYLQDQVDHALRRALARAGLSVDANAPVTIETTIVDAEPNHPTFKQLGDHVGLSMIDSISVGGAELHALIRGRDGQVLAEVSHREYSNSLADVLPFATEWFDANRAIQQFAVKVARACVQHAGG